MSEKNRFDATPSALGYLFQVRYALFLALEKATTVYDPDQCVVSLETLDDIAFESDGLPIELLQTKHHCSSGNLTDRSADLWKTFRVWAEMFSSSEKNFESTTYTLITTESAKDESLGALLGTDENVRDVDKAYGLMCEIANETSSQSNQKAYDAFLRLESSQQKRFLSSIYVISDSLDILEVEEKLYRKARLSVAMNHTQAFISRLEGVWFKKVIQVMAGDCSNRILISELVGFIDDLRNQFLPTNLPADFEDAQPNKIDPDSDKRLFVEQLRLIEAKELPIKHAIINYYRAFEQRSKWSREGLLKPGEIRKYLNSLKEKWETQAAMLDLTNDLSTERKKIDFGKALYIKCQTDGVIPIRPSFKPAYVAQGSYNSLAEEMEIGWHPDYKQLLDSKDNEGAA